MLCVDLSALKTDREHVQRAVNLADIIDTHTRPFPTTEEAASANYAPLSMCISVRSMYDNTVVATDLGHKTVYYTNMTNIGDFPHRGEDLIMYVSSLAVLKQCEFSVALEEVMTRHSQFQPIGLFNPDPGLIDPMIYSHVILSDEGMKLLEPCLKPGLSVVPIIDIKPEGNLKPLLDTLIIVKEESPHE